MEVAGEVVAHAAVTFQVAANESGVAQIAVLISAEEPAAIR
jgi:hypothetical protein